MKIKHIIGAVLMILGMLLCLGAVGQLDFLAAQGSVGASDERDAAIKSVIGIVLMGAAAYLNHDLEYDE